MTPEQRIAQLERSLMLLEKRVSAQATMIASLLKVAQQESKYENP